MNEGPERGQRWGGCLQKERPPRKEPTGKPCGGGTATRRSDRGRTGDAYAWAGAPPRRAPPPSPCLRVSCLGRGSAGASTAAPPAAGGGPGLPILARRPPRLRALALPCSRNVSKPRPRKAPPPRVHVVAAAWESETGGEGNWGKVGLPSAPSRLVNTVDVKAPREEKGAGDK